MYMYLLISAEVNRLVTGSSYVPISPCGERQVGANHTFLTGKKHFAQAKAAHLNKENGKIFRIKIPV